MSTELLPKTLTLSLLRVQEQRKQIKLLRTIFGGVSSIRRHRICVWHTISILSQVMIGYLRHNKWMLIGSSNTMGKRKWLLVSGDVRWGGTHDEPKECLCRRLPKWRI